MNEYLQILLKIEKKIKNTLSKPLNKLTFESLIEFEIECYKYFKYLSGLIFDMIKDDRLAEKTSITLDVYGPLPYSTSSINGTITFNPFSKETNLRGFHFWSSRGSGDEIYSKMSTSTRAIIGLLSNEKGTLSNLDTKISSLKKKEQVYNEAYNLISKYKPLIVLETL